MSDPEAPPDPFDQLLLEVAATQAAPAPPWEALEQQRYRLLGLLGSGGGGQVYKAYDEQLGRNVALKFLNSVGAEHSEQLINEARTQARIKHPGICQVFEVVENPGRPFIVMQLIDGPTLRDAAERLSQAEKIAILRKVAEAVAAAHQRGIIHRDLKPANIMLERATDGWHPYVMDFGLAREIDKTLSVGMVGTPHFMAPEQARGDVKAIGPATDVWALGATLYTLLTGKPPFDGDSILSILRSVEDNEPQVPSTVPRDLRAVVMRCLEKSPQDRYADAAALARDLTAFERNEPVSARRRSLTRSLRFAARRHAVAVTLVGALIVGATLASLWMRRSSHDWRPQIVPILPTYEEVAGALRVSPDGKQLLFSSSRGDEAQIYLQATEGGPTRPIAGTKKGVRPSFSSTGDAIYFVVEDEAGAHAKKLSLEPGSTAVSVMDAHELVECAGRIFFTRRDPNEVERLFTLDGGTERELARSDRRLRNISCSRDGERVAYYVGLAPEKVAWLDVKERVEHVLPPLGDNSLNPSFHTDGRTLLVQVYNNDEFTTLWEQRLDGSKARQLTTGGHEWSPRLAPDGRLFFSVGEVTRIFTARPLDGGTPHRVGPTGNWDSLEQTADGRSILTSRPTASGSRVILINLTDESERVVTNGQLPVAAPDGEHVYCVGDDGKSIWSARLDGSDRREIAQAPAVVDGMHAAADALHLTLAEHPAWRQPYDGTAGAPEGPPGAPMLMPAADGWTVVWGPQAVVWPPGPMPKTLPKPTRFFNPNLTADRRSFVARDAEYAVWLVDVASGSEMKLAEVPSLVEARLSKDGKTLYTLEDLMRTQRAVISNYAMLPHL